MTNENNHIDDKSSTSSILLPWTPLEGEILVNNETSTLALIIFLPDSGYNYNCHFCNIFVF